VYVLSDFFPPPTIPVPVENKVTILKKNLDCYTYFVYTILSINLYTKNNTISSNKLLTLDNTLLNIHIFVHLANYQLICRSSNFKK
jgi:hypothetical protein